jgi:hypothetical protein
MTTTPEPDVAQRFETLAREFLHRPGVTRGGRGFGRRALQVRGRIFASLTSRGQLIVTLPRQRVAALVAAGTGVQFDPGHGRLMREWLAVSPDAAVDWAALADEAQRFVGEIRRGSGSGSGSGDAAGG